jgi:soluble lytic murein transglycosylase-like protein
MRFGLTLRLFVALFTLFAASLAPASADETNELQYASLLRSINPQLQVHQSLAYAHSLVTDAERSNIDPRLIVALVTVESHWRPDALSPVGARGLGQLMPGTAATLGVNAWDPKQNIRGAATYLRAMLDHFAGSGTNTLRDAIGAYNAGPHAVDRYHGIPPFAETQNYVRKVLAAWRSLKIRFASAFGTDSLAGAPDAKLWLEDPNASALPDSAGSTAGGSGAAVSVAPVIPPAP